MNDWLADQVGACRTRIAARIAIYRYAEWQACLQSVDAIELPATENEINGTGPIVSPAHSAAKRQLVKRTQHQPVRYINIREAAFDVVVGV